jgi:hypothetical protein
MQNQLFEAAPGIANPWYVRALISILRARS